MGVRQALYPCGPSPFGLPWGVVDQKPRKGMTTHAPACVLSDAWTVCTISGRWVRAEARAAWPAEVAEGNLGLVRHAWRCHAGRTKLKMAGREAST